MRYTFEVDACALGGAAAILAYSFALNWWRARKGHRLCPGPQSSAWAWANPWRWFIRPRCGYDLHGLRADASGTITCPECARRLPSIAHARSHASRIRWREGSLTALALTWAVLSTPAMRDGRWIRHVPDWALIAHQRLLGNHGMGRLCWEMQSRLSGRAVAPEEVEWLIPGLITDLGDRRDELTVRQALWGLESIGRAAMPHLEAALQSSNKQRRNNAAEALRQIHLQLPFSEFPPSPCLLRVTAEGLRSDNNYSCARHGGVDFLVQYGEGSAPVLMGAMRGDDEQARLLAAGIAGMAGLTDLLPEAAPILLNHLKDNRTSDDAKFAATGLLGFGPDVMPYLEQARYAADDQQRTAVRLIALDLVAAEKELPELRKRVQTISWVHDDPARLGTREGYGDELPSISADAAGR